MLQDFNQEVCHNVPCDIDDKVSGVAITVSQGYDKLEGNVLALQNKVMLVKIMAASAAAAGGPSTPP